MKAWIALPAAVAVVALGVGVWGWSQLNDQYRGFSQPVMLEFRRGASSREMATELARAGVVRNAWLFLAARALHRGERLQAGEYRFEKPASPMEILNRIARGDIFYLELLVPEGFTIFDTADAVAKLGTISHDAFLAAAKDPAPIRDLDPEATTLEGYLFPSKYRVYKHTTARDLARQMTAEVRTRWLGKPRTASLHDTITLASMVEREARRREEQALVASVFHNRLAIGMKLDCDATTAYAATLENRYTGVIRRSDLESDNPYNTYRHAGLPPGPIASPGWPAVEAALTPAETNYLYFVAKADGSGGHMFSESLREHEAAVARYRSMVHH
jgi:UPF0755 protein